MTSWPTHCVRCGTDLGTVSSTVSKFNTDTICLHCVMREKAHPGYVAADAAEVSAVLAGDFNFPGVGCPDVLLLPPCSAEAVLLSIAQMSGAQAYFTALEAGGRGVHPCVSAQYDVDQFSFADGSVIRFEHTTPLSISILQYSNPSRRPRVAKLVTLQILVDEEDENRIADGLNDMLREAAKPVDPENDGGHSWIIDWRLAWCGNQMLTQSVSEEINDAICNGTYSEGDAFPGRSVPLLPGFEYDLIATDPKVLDSIWIAVPSHRPKDEGGDLSVLLKRTHEGAIVDIQPANQEDRQEILSTAVAEFSDAAHPEEAVPA